MPKAYQHTALPVDNPTTVVSCSNPNGFGNQSLRGHIMRYGVKHQGLVPHHRGWANTS